jgi:hypothetical protein
MVFAAIFILLALALPLTVEVYKEGSNNLIARSGREVLSTKPVKFLLEHLGSIGWSLGKVGDSMRGVLALVGLLGTLGGVLRLIQLLLRWLF